MKDIKEILKLYLIILIVKLLNKEWTERNRAATLFLFLILFEIHHWNTFNLYIVYYILWVKSIISTSCVVKFQLLHLINKINPEKILILAPVMYKNAQVGLIREFPDYINSKFQFLTFAIDTERSLSGEVIPGVGGMVYPKLGLGDIHEKNKYIPQLVLARLHNK